MSDLLSITNQDIRPTTAGSSAMGVRGEAIAAKFIEQQGYRIVMANFRTPVGRNSKGVQVTGEIDLIAIEDETLCFIEVKTRRSKQFAEPSSAVDLRKQRQITRAARVYRRIFGLFEMKQRFDIVTVVMEKGMKPQIELSRGFWTEAKFKKSMWNQEIW